MTTVGNFAKAVGRLAAFVGGKEKARDAGNVASPSETPSSERKLDVLMDKSKQVDAPLFTAAETPERRRAEAWLKAQLKRGEREPFAIIGDLSPALAEMLEARNSANRKHIVGEIGDIANDIAEGNYSLNGETVIISRCGQLNDGQNRCAAVRRAGRSIQTFFVFGVERETRLTTDQGRAKTPGAFLTMSGVEYGNTVAAIAGYLWQAEKYGEIPQAAHAPGYRPTKIQIRGYAQAKLDEIKAALTSVPAAGCARIASYSVVCVAYVLIARRAGSDLAAEFVRRLVTGDNLASGNPILAARNRLLDEKRSRSTWPHKSVEIILRAWNMHRRGKRSTKIQLMSAWPEIAR